MAVLDNTAGSLLDIAKSLDPDGKTADIVEILKKECPLLDHMFWMQANMEDGHRDTIRSGLPEGTWRRLYDFVQPNKSTRVQVKDSVGMLEAYSVVDKALIDLAGAAGTRYRFDEDSAHIMGMGHQLERTVFYGNESTEPAAFTGLAPRYNSLSAENKDNIIDAGGANSDNTSIWLIGWGKKRIAGIYPKNTKAGIQSRDLGEYTDTNSSGGKRQVLQSHYRCDAGLVVSDWRYGVRVCNVKIGNLTKDASSGADLVDVMTDAIERLPSIDGNTAFYCNRRVRSYLRRQMVNHKNVNISMEQVAGKRVMVLGEVPVYRSDSLIEAEARVT